jgi:hypothetical protein
MKLYSNLSKTAKIMFASATVICIILLILGLIVLNLLDRLADIQIEKSLPFATGIIVGYIHSVIKLIMLEKSLNSVMNAPEKGKAANIGQLLYMARFLFTGAILVFAFVFPRICGPVGTILGILSLQISAYTANIFLIRAEKNDNAVSADKNNENEIEDEEGDESEAEIEDENNTNANTNTDNII